MQHSSLKNWLGSHFEGVSNPPEEYLKCKNLIVMHYSIRRPSDNVEVHPYIGRDLTWAPGSITAGLMELRINTNWRVALQRALGEGTWVGEGRGGEFSFGIKLDIAGEWVEDEIAGGSKDLNDVRGGD